MAELLTIDGGNSVGVDFYRICSGVNKQAVSEQLPTSVLQQHRRCAAQAATTVCSSSVQQQVQHWHRGQQGTWLEHNVTEGCNTRNCSIIQLPQP